MHCWKAVCLSSTTPPTTARWEGVPWISISFSFQMFNRGHDFLRGNFRRSVESNLFIALIDLTKAFDLVSRNGLFKILPLIGCPPKLLSFIKSFHDGTQGTVQYYGSMSEAFNINCGVKQSCVLAPTLFNIFFSVLLNWHSGQLKALKPCFL